MNKKNIKKSSKVQLQCVASINASSDKFLKNSMIVIKILFLHKNIFYANEFNSESNNRNKEIRKLSVLDNHFDIVFLW